MIEFVLSSRKPYKKTETDFVALKTQAIQANRKLKKNHWKWKQLRFNSEKDDPIFKSRNDEKNKIK